MATKEGKKIHFKKEEEKKEEKNKNQLRERSPMVTAFTYLCALEINMYVNKEIENIKYLPLRKNHRHYQLVEKIYHLLMV